ncbi:hypothetical protein CK203_025278 [Vitis vinifera]|uniref:Uncharacterized protein n=1 Tax=Vitis vinifera TaxID=29760 RepID=A0A438JF08_VITVI|nr:hypothetical protein CK203_025278 [Vitis vinifera]
MASLLAAPSFSPQLHLKTCKICKTQFDPLLNHPRACRFHTAHFGGIAVNREATELNVDAVQLLGVLDPMGQAPNKALILNLRMSFLQPGETKRKFESVYTGGTMNTPDSGQVLQYWHCCGSEDPFDLMHCCPSLFL